MNATTDILIKDLAKTIANAPAKKVTPYDTQAEVRRVEGNIAWVHIPGGVDETPVQLTTNAKKGDTVQVRVSGGNAWLYGNQTAPPTDDTKATQAEKKAVTADEHASDAMISATLAKEAADSAQNSANQANTLLNYMEQAAEEADTTLTGIYQDAKDAKEYADAAAIEAGAATRSAQSAYSSASTAIEQLSVVENIVGVLDLVSKSGVYAVTTNEKPQPSKWYFRVTGTAVSNPTGDPHAQGWYELSSGIYSLTDDTTVTSGKTYYTLTAQVVDVGFDYILTRDTEIVADKKYYTRSGSGTEQDPYVYTEVENPVQADLGNYYEYTNSPAMHNYYELVSIDDAIQNYVSSHLVLVGNSLYLQTDEGEGSTRLELNTQNGMTLYDQTGNPVAQYGANTIIGNTNTFGIKIGESPTYILTDDTAIIPNKKYYERSGSGTIADPYVYTLVDNPVVADIGTYYENVLELGFYQEGERVAYINNNSLYITQTVVLQEMHLGERIENGGLGQWSWCVHQIGGLNNLYLKWLG